MQIIASPTTNTMKMDHPLPPDFMDRLTAITTTTALNTQPQPQPQPQKDEVNNNNNNNNNNHNGPRVAIIGFGPGGMSFCHALETKRRELETNGDWGAIAKLPVVCAFERASTHGGLWRDVNNNDAQQDEEEDEVSSSPATAAITNSSGMYDALWMNCIKERNEFFDYTFEEHFGSGVALPAFMPRNVMLDYMTKRVTKNTPDFFEKYATFNTEVSSVKYDATTQTFQVVTRNVLTGDVQSSEHDKCIWAAGEQGKSFVPRKLWNMFHHHDDHKDKDKDPSSSEEEDDEDDDTTPPSSSLFQGRVLHSADAGATLKDDVQGKKILLIGGSYSGEDLALMSIKLGAERVYISFRDSNAVVTWQNTWPSDKVELLDGQVPVGISEDGTCVQLAEVDPITYKPTLFLEQGTVTTELRGIDTVIFCTGYRWSFDMLDDSVSGGGEEATEEWSEWVKNMDGPYITLPEGWKMPENRYTEFLGDVEPASEEELGYWNDPYLYRSFDMNNPSMMYLFPADLAEAFSALVIADISSWLLLQHLSGSIPMPSAEIMRQRKQERLEYTMGLPATRLTVDPNYQQAFLKYNNGTLEKSDEDHDEELRYYFRVVAEMMQDGKYPVDIGTFDELNELGKRVVSMYHVRECGPETGETSWKTFRDLDAKHCGQIASIFSGCKPSPFKKPWLEIEDMADVTGLVDQPKRQKEEDTSQQERIR
jgi:hypothetical protein